MGIRKERQAWLNTLSLKERIIYDRAYGAAFYDKRKRTMAHGLAKKAVLKARGDKAKKEKSCN